MVSASLYILTLIAGIFTGFSGVSLYEQSFQELVEERTLAAQPALTAFQGGTGTTSPSGLLYGDETIRLKTVVIGDNLTFTGGTLSATAGGGGAAFPFTPTAWGNSTSTLIGFSNGIISNASSTFTSTVRLSNFTSGSLAVDAEGDIYKAATTTYSTGLTYANGAVTADLGTAITSSEITNDEIVNADINSAAAISVSKTALTAGDALTLTGDDIDFDGGAAPGGELGNTWASPTIDDSLAVSSWNLTTPTFTTNFTFDGVTVTGLTGADVSVVTGTAGTSGNCAEWDANGDLVDAGDPCGTGVGGGGSGGTFSTTTSTVAGQLINYPNNDDDIVAIGANATTSAEFYFDPNTLQAVFGTGAAGDSSLAFGPNTSNQWIMGYDETDKSFSISSSTALGTTPALTISKTGLAATLAGSLTVSGTNFIFGGDTFDELVGDGLDLSSGDLIFDCSDVASTGITCSGEDLTVSLGTSIDISGETNLTAGDGLTLTDDDIDFDGGASPNGDLGGTWAAITVDDDGHAHTGTTLSGIDVSDDVNLAATYPIILTGDTLSFPATSTLYGTGTAGYVLTWNNGLPVWAATSTCEAITGSASLCDGSDASGTGGTGLATSTGIVDTYVIYGTSADDVGNEAAFTYDDATNRLTFDYGSSTALSVSGSLMVDDWKLGTSSARVTKDITNSNYTTIQGAIDANWRPISFTQGTFSEQLTFANTKTYLEGDSLLSIIQCNGSSQSPCISTNQKDESFISNLTINEANASPNVGIAIDFSMSSLDRLTFTRINNFATSTKFQDTGSAATSNTFYSLLLGNYFANFGEAGIDLSGSQPNAINSAFNRLRPMQTADGGYGMFIQDTRGFLSVGDDIEGTTTSNGVTAVHFSTSTRDNTFVAPWIEANANGVVCETGSTNNNFFGGSITSNGTDIDTDCIGNANFIGVNVTGDKLNTLMSLGIATTTSYDAATVAHKFGVTGSSLFNGNIVLDGGVVIATNGGSANNPDIVIGHAGGPGIYSPAADTLGLSNGLLDEVQLNSTGFSPVENDDVALGTASLGWSDLHLATGGVINFANSNYTATHSSNLLTLSNSLTLSAGTLTAPSTSFTDATSTNLDVTGLLTFNGVTGDGWTDFCTTITGGAGLCDGNDATGAGGASYPFTPTAWNGLTTSATTSALWAQNGLMASSTTFMDNFRATFGTTTFASTTAISVSGLTASRAVFTDANSGLITTGTVGALEAAVGSQNIILETEFDACSELAALLDGETGTCNGSTGPVFPTNPTFVGLVATGLVDLGGADLEIPNGTGPTVDAVGELAIDTTSNNLILATSTNAGGFVAASATTTLYAFAIASTSPDMRSGGVIELPAHFLPQKVTGIICDVDAGTSVVLNLSNEAGSSDTNSVTCTTTSSQFVISSNAAYAAYAPPRLEVGTVTGSVDRVSIRIIGYRTTD